MAEPPKNTNDTVKPVLQPPIIMKVDAPSEDETKIADETRERNSNALNNEEFKMCSPTIRPSSFNSSNPFGVQNKLGRGILKHPQLNFSSVSSNSKPFVLKPSQLNQFSNKSDESDQTSTNTENGEKNHQKLANGELPRFVPLVGSETKPVLTVPPTTKESVLPTTQTSNCSFVFGQNLKERVVSSNNKQEDSKASTSLNSNGANEMLFSSAIKNEIRPDSSVKDKETKSLSESAREYEESRAVKRKYEEVEVITGEEDENNILKIFCKLFAFDKVTSSWQERGRGTLRLNDFQVEDHTGSRLVFRTTGSLRVIINTKIWAEMTVDKASDKSIRLTALDASGEVKVFLIMSSIEDSNKLFSHLQERLEREIAAQKRKKLNAAEDSGGTSETMSV